MTEMIERVARAIDPEAFSLWEYERQRMRAEPSHWREGDWKEMDGFKAERQDKARDRARAAIAAMREPTKEMVHPDGTAIPYFDYHRSDDAAAIWRAMIDMALTA